MTVDSKLEPTDGAGHWKEVSAERSRLMAMYNRYVRVSVADISAAMMMPMSSKRRVYSGKQGGS
jgi:hypothetical protein